MDDPEVIADPAIAAYDLELPASALFPPVTSLRDALWGPRTPPPRYVPGPLAEGSARVVLSEGEPYDGPSMTSFIEYGTYPVRPAPHDVFDVPAGQLARWKAAMAAYEAAVDEMDALISQRQQR